MIRHISEETKKAGEYIEKRSQGLIKSLKFGYPKLDGAGIDGVEWGSIVGIGGRPAVGKSIFSECLLTGATDEKNNEQDFVILDNNWEMAARVQILRKLAGDMLKSYKQICSADGKPLSQAEIDRIKNRLEVYSRLPVYIEDEPKTPIEFADSVRRFRDKQKKKIIVRVDHTLLAKISASDGDRVTMLLNLLMQANQIKKEGDIIFLFLTQINREFEDRQKNGSDEAFPRQGDVYGGDSCAMFCDMLILLNNPSKHKIMYYGKKPHGISVEENDLFAHVVKNRNSEPNLVINFKTNFEKMIMEEF